MCVEPYPSEFLAKEEKQGRIVLRRKKAQALEMKAVEELSSDVLFFVDSTHTLGPMGECSRIILEMLPRLKRGARVHFHDIYFPYDYDRHILDTALFFWHESVLLHAFLAYNSRFRLLTSMAMLHYSCPAQLAEYLPHYQPAANDEGLSTGEGHSPCSAYLEVVGKGAAAGIPVVVPHGHAAIDRDDLAGDVAGLVGREEGHRGGRGPGGVCPARRRGGHHRRCPGG